MAKSSLEQLKRPIYSMPEFVEAALAASGLRSAYEARPPYQRNDYLWWISSAKRPSTQERRLQQMLDELASGDRYMNMPYAGGSQNGSTDKEK